MAPYYFIGLIVCLAIMVGCIMRYGFDEIGELFIFIFIGIFCGFLWPLTIVIAILSAFGYLVKLFKD